jgi:hypothetical protein
MNLDAERTLETKAENEEKVPKQLSSMQTDDVDNNDGDNSERIPQLRSLSDYEVSVPELPISVSYRI